MMPNNYWNYRGKGDIHDSKSSTGTGTVMVKPDKSTASRQSVDGVRKLLQEAAAEPTNCTEMMPGETAYIAFIEESGKFCRGV